MKAEPVKALGELIVTKFCGPQEFPHCGSVAFVEQPMAVQRQQVAQLLERPIEVVEYHRLTCRCADCGEDHIAPWPESIVPGQDLGVSLRPPNRYFLIEKAIARSRAADPAQGDCTPSQDGRM